MCFPPAIRLRHLLLLLVLATPALSTWAGEFDEAFFKRSYAGAIDGKLAFNMELRKAGGVLRGSYRYAGKSAALDLDGKIAADGAFTLEEKSGDKVTGEFKGRLAGEKISGMWSTPKGAKQARQFGFEATQTAQADLHDKPALLRGAVGVYRLESISGSAGANGMYDTWREGRGWKSNSSAISGGMREAEYAKLTGADRSLLDSMQISVDAALTVRFSAGGKTLLQIPYTPGPDYRLGKPHNSVVTEGLAAYRADRSVVEDALFLLLNDGVDYGDALKGNFELDPSDVLLVLYKPAEGAFELDFKNGDCCGGAGLVFRRK
ncbi:MAG TPA: hypothetical protein VGN52_23770 [Burkholderiales bacterium]